MNMASLSPQDFANARPVAQHCAELTDRGPRPEERAELLNLWRRDLAMELAIELAPLLSGGKLHVTLEEPDLITGGEVFERIGPAAANCLLRVGEGDQTALLSLDLATAIALTDRSFGGAGTVPADVPSQLPRSAAMLIEQFGATIAQTVVMASGAAEHVRGDVLVRSESVSRLKPFASDEKVSLFKMSLAHAEDGHWSVLFAVSNDRLDSLLPGMNPVRPRGARSERHNDPAKGPFGQMPLTLEAILSEFEMSLDGLERLRPGDEIPLLVARDLPLRIGDSLLGHGTIGSLDNHMAVRLKNLARVGDAAEPVDRAGEIQADGYQGDTT